MLWQFFLFMLALLVKRYSLSRIKPFAIFPYNELWNVEMHDNVFFCDRKHVPMYGINTFVPPRPSLFKDQSISFRIYWDICLNKHLKKDWFTDVLYSLNISSGKIFKNILLCYLPNVLLYRLYSQVKLENR